MTITSKGLAGPKQPEAGAEDVAGALRPVLRPTFLPEDFVRDQREARASIGVLGLFGVVLVLTGAAFAFNSRAWLSVRSERRAVAAAYDAEAAKLEQLRQLEARRQKLLEKADVVSALADPVPRSVLLGELLRSQPDGVALTSVELNGRRVKPPSHQDEKKSPTVKPAGQEPPRRVPPPRFEHEVVVNGEASDNTGVADLLRSIGESPLFGEVNLEFIADAQRDGLDLRGFRVTMKLRAEADGADALRLRLVGAPSGAERFGEGER